MMSILQGTKELLRIKAGVVLLSVLVTIGLTGGTASVWAETMGAGAGSVIDPAVEAYLPTIGLKGKLVVVGSDTMEQLMTRFGAQFEKWYSGLDVSVETEGSVGDFDRFLEWSASGRSITGDDGKGKDNAVMILASSKEMSPEHAREFVGKLGYPPMEVQIALGAVSVYVHGTNPVKELTLEQLDAMFGTTRKRGGAAEITKWGQLGLRGEWEQKPIRFYGRDRRSGTRALFKTVTLLGGEFKSSVQEEPGANSLVLAVSNDPQAIGYAGVLFKQYSSVKVVALAEKAGKPFILPNSEEVRKGLYPLSRKLYLYVNKAPSEELSPVVREFLEFAHSREGQETVVVSGFYPLPMNLLSQNLAMIKNPSTMGKTPGAK